MSRGEELRERIFKEESGLADEKIKKKKKPTKPKGVRAASAFKSYADNYQIYRVGTIYSSDYIVQMIYNEGSFVNFELLTPGSREIPTSIEDKNYLRARLDVRFQCCYAGTPANDPVEITIEIIDGYENERDMPNLNSWINSTGYEATERIAEDECSDWNDTYSPCPNSIEILRIIESERITKVSAVTLGYIRELEGYIRDSEENIASMEDQISDILAVPTPERTTEQKEEIKRLDDEIRDEREFIKESEKLIKETKKEAGIK